MRWFPSLVCFSVLSALVGCGDKGVEDDTDDSAGALEVRSGDLWAGSVTSHIQRNGDPCADDDPKLDRDPVVYDEFARQRASERNICFEVWKSGVTDADNPDFWRLLDVQAHFRFVGAQDWRQAPVNSVGRHGNNRRYAFPLGGELDPLATTSTIGDIMVPFTIQREQPESVDLEAKLEVYFTVNGQRLSASNDNPFGVSYPGTARKMQLQQLPNGHVLHTMIECDGLKLGGGPGYYAADITDQTAIDDLGGNRASSLIYNPATALVGTGQSRIFSVRFEGAERVSGQSLDSWVDGRRPMPRAETRPNGTSLTLMVSVHERPTLARNELTHAFQNCHAVP